MKSGTYKDRAMTHDQIGKVMGLSKTSVLHIERSALAKLSRMPHAIALLRAASEQAEQRRSRITERAA